MSRGGFPGGMGGFGGMNMNQIMKQAKKMQEEMQKSQENITNQEFESTAGGGAIYVKVNGAKELLEVKLDKDIVDPDDIEMLQDLIITCVNDAFKKVDSASNAEFGKYNIPGL